jgi:hypothetical protein
MGKKRFAGSVSGSDHSTTADRFSSQGITGHIRGWDTGIKVIASVNNGDEVFDVYVTSGSNGGHNDKYVGRLVNDEWFIAFHEEA